MAPRIPEIEVADDADPLRVRRKDDEGHARHALQHHRMGAKLLVKPLVGAFAEQVKVVVGQHRRKAIGVVEIDHRLAEAGAQLIRGRAVGKKSGKQAVVVNARQSSRLAMRSDRVHPLRFGQEGAHDRSATFGVRAEILEGVGVPAFEDRIGFGGQLGHAASRAGWDKIRKIRASVGGRASGRCISSVSSTSKAFSSRKKSTMRCAAMGSSGQIEEFGHEFAVCGQEGRGGAVDPFRQCCAKPAMFIRREVKGALPRREA